MAESPGRTVQPEEKTTDVSRLLATFVSRFQFDSLPEKALSVIKLGLLDSIGVALAGSKQPAGTIAAEFAQSQGTGPASTWGHGASASPALAALANGTAAHALDYDDVNWALLGHPSASLSAATIAVGEQVGVSGLALMGAYACGFEVMTKIGRSCMPDFSLLGGWHATSVIGSVGTAAAVSRILGLNEEQAGHALGIAVSHASGVVSNFGTMTKPLHAGLAAQAGIQAAGLASLGFTSSPDALNGKHGFFSAYARGLPLNLGVIEEIGKIYELERSGLVIKPYPCGVAGHPAIDAAIALRDRVPASDLDAIERIDVGATSYTIDKMRYGWPADELQAKFSLPYQTARALVSGRVRIADFSPDALHDDPRVRAIAEKTAVYLDESIEKKWRELGGSRPCRIKVRFSDGRTEEELVEISKGNPEVPLTREELRMKFRDSASIALDADAVETALETVENIEGLDDVRNLGLVLRGRSAND